MTLQKLTQWENSLGIRLPQEILRQLGWKEGSNVTLSLKEDSIILSVAKPKYKLEDLLKNSQSEQQHEEIDWGEASGAENW